ncbi:MAG: helix-turn-helix domain-containing protein [Ktedonobacteraceae bacterium]|nr:helix-turn-helix domain-containing protein [Ktedonobacteraceae bacterium]
MDGEVPEFFTVGEVARRLRIDPSTLRRWIRQGLVEAVVLPARGGRQSFRIPCASVAQLVRPYQQGGRF